MSITTWLGGSRGSHWYDPSSWGDESNSALAKRDNLTNAANAAGAFAGQGEAGYGAMTDAANASRQNLADIASGKTSYSAEGLRQGLQQNLAAQQSMAAGAAPQNAAMAARTAAIQAGRLGAGLAGQQAMAGIAEREGAAKALQDAILQQRGQDVQVGLGGRSTQLGGIGAVTPDKSFLDKWGGAIIGGLGAYSGMGKGAGGSGGGGGVPLQHEDPYATSDKRLKTDVRDGDGDAQKALEGLRAFSYRYKDEKHGKGDQLGVMAQDLEKGPLKHTVVDTPKGKLVHGAKLATANTAMLAGLAKRVKDLEGKGG